MPNRPISRSIISCDQAEYYIRKRLLRTVSGTDQDADWMREAFLFCAREDSPRQLFLPYPGRSCRFLPVLCHPDGRICPAAKSIDKNT